MRLPEDILLEALVRIAFTEPGDTEGDAHATSYTCPICEDMIDMAREALQRYWGLPTNLALIPIVTAINSAGETLTIEEAKSIVAHHGGKPEWIDSPPPWARLVNTVLAKYHS